jgi:DNA-binding GntR family transcriptional regulator
MALRRLGRAGWGRRKPSIPTATVEEIVRATLQDKPVGETHWSCRSMARVQGVRPATVQRIWSARGLKPHLVETFKLSNVPCVEEKLVDVVGLYLSPPDQAVVLCMDEKSQIQALDRTQPTLPMKRGRAGTMTHDSKRNGTTTLATPFEAGLSLQAETLENKVTDLLRERIITGALRATTTVSPRLIAGELSVSLTPVNHALKRLEAEGYVRILPRKGLVVAPLCYEDLEELTVQRAALEGFATECAVPRMQVEDIARLERMAGLIDHSLLTAPRDAVTMFRLDQNFHLAVYEPARRPSLLRTIVRLRDRERAYMHLASALVMDHMYQSQRVHRQILDACRERDVERATEVVQEHVHHVLDVSRQLLTTSLEKSDVSQP